MTEQKELKADLFDFQRVCVGSNSRSGHVEYS